MITELQRNFGTVRHKGVISVIATTFLLAACGGGGTGNDGGNPPQTVRNADSQTNDVVRDAAESIPTYGSVSQLYGASPSSSAQVEKDGSGYSITLPSDSSPTIVLDSVNDNRVNYPDESSNIPGLNNIRHYTLEKGDNDKSTFAGVYETEFSDGNWLVGGWWLHGAGLAGNQPTFEVGSFVDGPEISSRPSLPSGGTAEYNGEATGLYTIIPGTDLVEGGEIIIGEYFGDFTATANFNNGGGTVSGRVIVTSSDDYFLVSDDYSYVDEDYVSGVQIHWANVEFSSNGEATGDITSVTYPGLVFTSVEGKTGNKFSSIPDSEGNPRFIAGTHGGSVETSGGTQAGFIGVHGGGTGE